MWRFTSYSKLYFQFTEQTQEFKLGVVKGFLETCEELQPLSDTGGFVWYLSKSHTGCRCQYATAREGPAAPKKAEHAETANLWAALLKTYCISINKAWTTPAPMTKWESRKHQFQPTYWDQLFLKCEWDLKFFHSSFASRRIVDRAEYPREQILCVGEKGGWKRKAVLARTTFVIKITLCVCAN